MLFNEALSERETLHLDTAMCKAMCLLRAIKKNYTVMEWPIECECVCVCVCVCVKGSTS